MERQYLASGNRKEFMGFGLVLFIPVFVSFKRVFIAQNFVSYHLLDPAPNVLGHESPSE
jgi:hypothetical protein